jgi:hypothetical protein
MKLKVLFCQKKNYFLVPFDVPHTKTHQHHQHSDDDSQRDQPLVTDSFTVDVDNVALARGLVEILRVVVGEVMLYTLEMIVLMM